MIHTVLLAKTSNKLSITSCAKVNLNLSIIGRKQGYHLLQSYFVPFKCLYDKLTINIADSDHVSLKSAPYIPQFDDNIIAKTIHIMRQSLGFKEHFEVDVQKNIPINAGLGGGSGNAATTINAIDQILAVNLSANKKIQIASQIGADVPFFIYNKPAIVEGFGEIITLSDHPGPPHMLVVTPNFGCSTADVFAKYKELNAPFSKPRGANQIISNYGLNDLQPAAIALKPQIADIINAIAQLQGCVASGMSGSGSSCFGVFKTALALNNAKQSLNSKHREYLIFG